MCRLNWNWGQAMKLCRKISAILLMVAGVSLFSFGSASWLFTTVKSYSNSEITNGNVEGDKEVCYIDSDVDGNRYTSIEIALAVAKSNLGSQKIYVKPNLGFTVKIKRDCEISSEDSLILPYEGTTEHSYVGGTGHKIAYEGGTRTSFVEIQKDVTFINNGTLTIGAIQSSGNGGSSPNGNAADKYTEINLLDGANLINNGTINCWGYISGNKSSKTKITCTSTSTVNMPYVVIEHRGGSRYAGMCGKDSSEVEDVINSSVSTSGNRTGEGKPVCYVFNRWYLDGFLDVNFEFEYGSKLIGKAALYADGEHNTTDMKIITQDGLIRLENGSLLTGIFDKTNKKCSVNTLGSWILGNLNVYFAIKKKKKVPIFDNVTAFVKVNVSSKNILLPIPYYFDVTLRRFKSGSVAIVDALSQGFKLLPGSSLTVNSGVTLKAKDIAVYRNESLYPNGKTVESGDLGNSPYPQKADAILKNNGSINTGSIGGDVLCSSTASVEFVSNSITGKEAHDFTAKSIKVLGLVSIDIYIPNYADVGLALNKVVNA